MSNIKIIVAFLLTLAFFGFASVAQAGGEHGTKLGAGYYGDQVWGAEGSPYYLSGQLQFKDASLTIEEGVEVIGSDSMSGINLENGFFNVMGTKANPVKFTNLGIVNLTRSTSTIRYSEFNSQGIALYPIVSSVYIASSTFNGAGIYSMKSDLDVVDSRIINHPYQGLVVTSDDGKYAHTVRIHNSVIEKNGKYGIKNDSFVTDVDASNNWWGSPEGPYGENNIVSIGVNFQPWLTERPLFDEEPVVTCCSNVLFIPGLEGTRLYSQGKKLWEAETNANVQSLYLARDGTSLNAVYSGEPISKAYGLKDIYGNFMSFLDGLVSAGTIKEWKAFGYDWRKPISEVVEGFENTADGVESIYDSVLKLASTSPTKKVTLVAHSNGGLIAKYLVSKLSQMGKSGLVDTVISAGVPYLGTPQALAGLLHGGDQSILSGFMVSESMARGLGANMPSAYSLLPSAEFFQNALKPSIAFASDFIPGVRTGNHPDQITNGNDQEYFVADPESQRQAPYFWQTNIPIRGNSLLMEGAKALHAVLDNYHWPSPISTVGLVGFNADTTAGLLYKLARVCYFSLSGLKCPFAPMYEQTKDKAGDGTVLSLSAGYDLDKMYNFDLEKISRNEDSKVRHANILNSKAVEDVIANLIAKNSSFDLPEGVTKEIPGPSSPMVRISTHSPVELHVYDSEGNHTGPVPLPDGFDSKDSFLGGSYETNIPGSEYVVIPGEDGFHSYVSVPLSIAERLRVEVLGMDFGYATLQIEKDEQSGAGQKYNLFSVTPLSVATLYYGDDLALHSDINGDGVGDMSILSNPDSFPNRDSGYEMLRLTIEAIAPGEKGGKLIERLEKIRTAEHEGKIKQAEKMEAKLSKKLEHMSLKSMGEEDKNELISRIEGLIAETEALIVQ